MKRYGMLLNVHYVRFLFLCLLLYAYQVKAQAPPNVILILADDMGYGDLGCYGQQKIKTPNIDRLASEGIQFTTFYAGATVCAPSRAALLTGLHNGHSPVRGNQPFPQILNNEPTIAGELKKAGYTSAVIGKWGIGHPQPVGDPQRAGFDYSFGYLNMWHAHNFYPEFLYENDKKVVLPGNKLKAKNAWSNDSWVGGAPQFTPEGYGEAAEKITYAPDVMEQKALSFIDQNRTKPFFLFFTTTIPHSNNEIKLNGMEVPEWGIYEKEPWPDVEKGFAAAITRLDATVGKIVAHLKALGLEKNTLLLFTSDNGPHGEAGHSPLFFQSSGIFKGKKRDLYEGGLRVPLIAWWPGKIAAGTKTELPAAQWDFLPTFLELAGQAPSGKTDGVSLVPTLTGNTSRQKKHPYLYWEFYEEGGKQSVLQYPWKLMKFNTTTFAENGRYELYNLASDPGEKNDLSASQPKRVKSLKKIIKKAHQPHPKMSINRQREGMGGKI